MLRCFHPAHTATNTSAVTGTTKSKEPNTQNSNVPNASGSSAEHRPAEYQRSNNNKTTVGPSGISGNSEMPFSSFLTMHLFFGNGNKKRQVRVAAHWLSGISGRIRTSYRSFCSKPIRCPLAYTSACGFPCKGKAGQQSWQRGLSAVTAAMKKKTGYSPDFP